VRKGDVVITHSKISQPKKASKERSVLSRDNYMQRRYDMNGRSQMQGGKNWILPKEINANRFF
jgi:hypothetical protein